MIVEDILKLATNYDYVIINRGESGISLNKSELTKKELNTTIKSFTYNRILGKDVIEFDEAYSASNTDEFKE